MPSRRRKTLQHHQQIAGERISILLDLSREVVSENQKQAKRYLDLARRLGMRYKVRIPVEFRRLICRRCKSLIIPGFNARVRVQQHRESHVVITCFECGGHNRFPLRMRMKARK